MPPNSALPRARRCSCDRRTARCAPRVHLAPIRPGNVQAFFPEANVLLAPSVRDRVAGVPDYNAVVEVVPIA